MAKTKRTPVDFSELGGFRYLHFGSEWIQGGMRINRPYSLALEYQQYMLALLFFRPEPKNILQLGSAPADLRNTLGSIFPKRTRKWSRFPKMSIWLRGCGSRCLTMMIIWKSFLKTARNI